MTFLVVLLVVVAVLALWVVGQYNTLVTLRNQVQNGWKQIDVQLKRRHDLIPNLVNTVKGIMEFEQETLQKVIAARNAAVGATGVADAAAKENVAHRRALAPLRAGGELPDAEVERERPPAAGGAVQHREQDQLRTAVLQRHRDQVQHRAAGLPGQHHRRDLRLHAVGAVRDHGRRRARRPQGRPFAEEVAAGTHGGRRPMNPRNIYEQQSANRRNTLFVMTGFVLLVGLIGLGFDATILGIVPGDPEIVSRRVAGRDARRAAVRVVHRRVKPDVRGEDRARFLRRGADRRRQRTSTGSTRTSSTRWPSRPASRGRRCT